MSPKGCRELPRVCAFAFAPGVASSGEKEGGNLPIWGPSSPPALKMAATAYGPSNITTTHSSLLVACSSSAQASKAATYVYLLYQQ